MDSVAQKIHDQSAQESARQIIAEANNNVGLKNDDDDDSDLINFCDVLRGGLDEEVGVVYGPPTP